MAPGVENEDIAYEVFAAMDRSRPMIQLALDCLDSEMALSIAEECLDFVDIIEIGTPCLKVNGIQLVKDIARLASGKQLLADLKTMDAGEYEVEPFYQSGASICTVLGAASLETIAGAKKSANRHSKQLQVDLINVGNKRETAKRVTEIGVDLIGIHTGIDSQAKGETPFADLKLIKDLNLPARISVAGGINAETASMALELGAGIVVIGGAITSADNPRSAAQEIYESLK